MSRRIDTKKTVFFRHKILDFVRKAGREHLPWRKEGITAYEVWVSEVMLQQTQVSRVIGYYEKFLKKFPMVQDLARADWEEFLPYYAGLGYYQRGRNILATAKIVVEQYQGEFPRAKTELMQLPGIGDYTASAILSFAHDESFLAYDTNLKRVLGRFFFGTKKAFDSVHGQGEDIQNRRDFFEKKLRNDAREMNAGLMDFGSSICVGRPKCSTCPLASQCVYFAENGAQEQRPKEERIDDGVDWKQTDVLVFLHEKHRRYFSSRLKSFAPFLIPKTHNTRAGIKAYFKERYDLELAVRPPHAKVVSGKRPFLLVNAQILLGVPMFVGFLPDDVKRYVGKLKQ